jgi:hypothetical protein
MLTPDGIVIPITSNPSGAKVLCDGELLGTTPCSVILPSQYRSLWMEREGCQPRAIDLGDTSNPWAALNILNLGVGLAIDTCSGMHRVPNPAPAHVALRQAGARQSTPIWIRLDRPYRGAVYGRAGGRRSGLGSGVGAMLGGILTAVNHHNR